MATQYIARRATALPASSKPHASPIYVDSDDNRLKLIPAATGTTEVVLSEVTQAPVAAGATLTVTAALHAGKIVALDTSGGSAITLPAATATGNIYTFIETVASNAHTISAAGADKMAGGILINDVGDTAAATADFYRATVASSNKISPTTAGGGGAIGDFIVCTDVLSAVWMISGVFQTSTDPVNPFSAV